MPRPPLYMGLLPTAARIVLQELMTDPKRTWRFGEVRTLLMGSGRYAKARADATTTRGFQYLVRDGIVVQESRGAYRIASESWIRFFDLERALREAKEALEQGGAHVWEADGATPKGLNVRTILVYKTRNREGDPSDFPPLRDALLRLIEHLSARPEGSLLVAYSYRFRWP